MNAMLFTTAGTILAVSITAAVAVWRFYYERNTERRRINTALLAEIHRLVHDVIPWHWKWWVERISPDDDKLPLIPFTTPIYDEHAKNIGFLDNDIVASVASFYGYIKFLSSLQASRVEYEKLGDLSEFGNLYGSALKTAFNVYKKDFQKPWENIGIRCGERCVYEHGSLHARELSQQLADENNSDCGSLPEANIR